MVKSTKRCLKKILGRACFSHDELLTAVTEIESVINSRPLSYVSVDDTEEALTPSHLMTGRRVRNLPDNLDYLCDPTDEKFELDSSQLSKRLKHLNGVMTHFWKRWRREYLAELRESHRYLLDKSQGKPKVVNGDIVLVHDEALPRGFWKLGRIQSVIVGVDGQARAATVKLMSKNGRSTLTLNRPLQRLYPLEIKHEPTDTSTTTSAPDVHHEPQDAPNPRPRRAAAIRCQEQRKEWMRQDMYDDSD